MLRFMSPLPQKRTIMKSDILTTETELADILPAWRDLYRRASNNLFSHPDFYLAWWQHLGSSTGWKLHVVTLRDGGRLVGVAPLAVIKRKGFRILQWAGIEALDYNDTLVESPEYNSPLWDAVRQSNAYDVAMIKDVLSTAPSCETLGTFAQPLQQSHAYYIPLVWKDSETWLKSYTADWRKDYKRRFKRLEAHGPIHYEVYETLPIDNALMDLLVEQKRSWCRQTGNTGMFDHPGVNAFLMRLAEVAAEEKALYFCVLRCGDAIISIQMGFQYNGALYWYMTSYDGEWGKLSPGRVQMYKAIAWAIDHGLTEFDYLRGGESYKQSLTDSSRILNDYMFSRGIKGFIAKKLYGLKKGTAEHE